MLQKGKKGEKGKKNPKKYERGLRCKKLKI
jgi:hypothetical protein